MLQIIRSRRPTSWLNLWTGGSSVLVYSKGKKKKKEAGSVSEKGANYVGTVKLKGL
jgi:hypothetical protein